MYKVVIVDDEEIIVRGLKQIVPWEKFGCEVVATAGNATDGAAIIRETKPDILFTDIRMPGCDGLTMLAGLRAEYPDMQVSVLTGHRDFTYAQQAIRLGVSRFLLKPSKMEELVEALETMTAKLAAIVQPTAQAAAQGNDDTEPAAPNDAAGSFVARKAVQYIEEHCCEHVSLSEVAEACYVSQWHLSKLLGRHGGQNFYDILNTARIAQAKQLLLDPALTIGEIAELAGYTDTPHFSRVFKKLEGISANEYRNTRLV